MSRITKQQALELLKNAELKELGIEATKVKKQLHPDNITTFIVDRNINYTNICNAGCKFCAFKRGVNDEDGYVLDHEVIANKIDELIEIGGTQILFQGGVHPKLKIDYYEELVDFIHSKYPQITIHGFSAAEISYIAKVSEISRKDVLKRLQAKGLSSIPGAGAEILADRVRNIISPNKLDTAGWLDIHKSAHEIGMRTTATMMFGSVETDEEIVEHLEHLRALQDETGGFRAFILWSFQPDNTPLFKEYPNIIKATSNRYLRILALSRLYLDNFKNLQSSWVTQGSHIGQSALFFGANDMGSTMMEENVVAAAGAANKMAEDEIVRLIQDAGEIAAKRNTAYEILRVYE